MGHIGSTQTRFDVLPLIDDERTATGDDAAVEPPADRRAEAERETWTPPPSPR